MASELAKTYDPQSTQSNVTQRWLEADAFEAMPDGRDDRFTVMMPLPNVTGALHMGHAIDNVMQDLLSRWHRMQGHNTLWQPGTDHAGIATQAVVEKRLYELEGKTRHELGREALVKRIWQWKDEYQKRIIHQQQQMGCSCDWRRQRFTMDAVCSAAVREVFFRLFRDHLIYRGDRLVNWDCQLQTAVADDEVYHETIQGHFWHFKYPVIEPKKGEPTHVQIATTRPETMLGDTAVATHPEPRRVLEQALEQAKRDLNDASDKELESAQEEVARLEARIRDHLPLLEQLVSMAKDGRMLTLPLMERPIPLILDEWAKPNLGSGCVKITPAHDPNDYDVWTRHRDHIGIVNVLNPDGTFNQQAGSYQGLDRYEVRKKVIADLDAKGLLVETEDREIELGHSDRSKTPVEPYLSKQWFVRMSDVEGGVTLGKGTPGEFTTSGLAQAAIDAVSPEWSTTSGRRLTFHPKRYTGQYASWLSEKRDWCISRQLWWGHQIPVWLKTVDGSTLKENLEALPQSEDIAVSAVAADGSLVGDGVSGPVEILVCLRSEAADASYASRLERHGFTRDPDVLDTWFSSALWPFSTLGWPNPEDAPIDKGQRPLGPVDGQPSSFDYYYPGSCLVTGRDIITLWVARMVIMGLYNHGDVPFTDCFVHAKILDGKGITMSKSKGNGVDPVDVINRYGADAMRYVVCDMETGMQDVRLPVQADCPSCSKVVELAEAKHGRTIFTYRCTHCSEEFDVLGTMTDVPQATIFSDRFDVGRSFCNKLWNAARFAMMNLQEHKFESVPYEALATEDRWILSRLNRASQEMTQHLQTYAPSLALGTARDFFWNEFCDWYLEIIKPRMKDAGQAPNARQVLSFVLDQVLRLFHPFVPFITEALWEQLGTQVQRRGIESELEVPTLCMHAPWPTTNPAWTTEALESDFEAAQKLCKGIREVRARYNVPLSKELPVTVRVDGPQREALLPFREMVMGLTRASSMEMGPEVNKPKNAGTHVEGDIEISVGDVLDPEKEAQRLKTQLQKLEKQLDVSKKKLANEKFVNHAPPEVVETERQRLADTEHQIGVITQNLQSL